MALLSIQSISVVICINKDGCTAQLNVQASTEISGHGKKCWCKQEMSISKDSRSYTFTLLFLSHILFYSLSLTLSATFHSSFSSSYSFFFSSHFFCPATVFLHTVLRHVTCTQTVYVQQKLMICRHDVACEICLAYQRKQYKGF